MRVLWWWSVSAGLSPVFKAAHGAVSACFRGSVTQPAISLLRCLNPRVCGARRRAVGAAASASVVVEARALHRLRSSIGFRLSNRSLISEATTACGPTRLDIYQ